MATFEQWVKSIDTQLQAVAADIHGAASERPHDLVHGYLDQLSAHVNNARRTARELGDAIESVRNWTGENGGTAG